MRIIVMSIIALTSYLLQTTLFDYIEIYGIRPNLIIIITISYALIRGYEEGAIFGLFSGLLMDILGGKVIGLFAILGMFLGLIIGILNKNIYKENYLIPALLTAGGTLVYNFLLYLFSYFSITQDQFIKYVLGYFIPEAIYNAIFTVLIYFLVLYINKKIDYYGKTSRIFKNGGF